MKSMKWRCIICNEVFEGEEPPEVCPVCGAGRSAFEPETPPAKTKWKCIICNEEFEGEKPPEICPVCGASASAFVEVESADQAETKDTQSRFVIIGGGVAGLECAKTIREGDATCSITLVCAEEMLPYNRPALSDVIEDNLSFASIQLQDQAWFDSQRIRVVFDQAIQIDRAEKSVKMKEGAPLSYDKLVMATGANSFCPIAHDQNGIPLFTLRNYQDVTNIMAQVRFAKKAVVIGGGILGIEAAVALREQKVLVEVVEIAPHIMPMQADAFSSGLLRTALEKSGVQVHTKTSVTAVTQTGVVLANNQTLEADFVLVSAGIRSEITLAKKAGLAVNRGIVVDNTMQTCDESIYAVGDCAEYNGQIQGLWATASLQGQTAGAVLTGRQKAYVPTPPATVFEGAGLSFFSAGNINIKYPQQLSYYDQHRKIYKAFIFDNNRLSGAVLLGDTTDSIKVLSLITAGASKADVLELL